MNFKSLLVALLATTVGFASYAEDTTTGETKTKVESTKKVDGDLDNEITNARMRADSGSKSKVSASLGISYSGGSIKDIGSHERGNLLGGNTKPAVLLSTDISGRYRLDKNASVSGGFGITIIQPFHSTDKNNNHDKYMDKVEASNPYISYSNYRRKGNWMISNSASMTVFTGERYVDANYLGNLDTGMTGLYDFKNGIQLGLNGSMDLTLFNAGGSIKGNGDSDVGFYINPFAEYAINDTYNLRTVLNFALYHTVYNAENDLLTNKSSHWANGGVRQSFGLGIAASRDVFLYPNVQISARDFYADASFENSTVGMSATINAF